MEQKNDLSTLPYEMVIEIFSRLDDYSLMQMLSVSRKFNKIIQGEDFSKYLAAHREHLYNIISAKNDKSFKARAEKKKLGYKGTLEYYKQYFTELKNKLQDASKHLEESKTSELLKFSESLKKFQTLRPITLASNIRALGVHIWNFKNPIKKVLSSGLISLIGTATTITLLSEGAFKIPEDDESETISEFIEVLLKYVGSIAGAVCAVLGFYGAVSSASSNSSMFHFKLNGYLRHPIGLLHQDHVTKLKRLLEYYPEVLTEESISYISDIVNIIETYTKNITTENPLIVMANNLIKEIDEPINLLDKCKNEQLPLKKLVETQNYLAKNANSFFTQYHAELKNQGKREVTIKIEDQILTEKTPLLENLP